MYTVGIDVGGTNTDAALLYDSKVVAMAKVPTNHAELFTSTWQALNEVLLSYGGQDPLRLHLSTTLSTNAIVEDRGVPTQVVAVPGPGVNLETLNFPFTVHELTGYIDHRGREVSPLVEEQVQSLSQVLGSGQGEAVGIVGKFSQRNPSQENKLASALKKWYQGTISLGHRLSGKANFPRRIVTTYLNASVAQHQLDFLQMWEEVLEKLEIPLQNLVILKADGGTMTLTESAERPIETILSGPAASIMGVQALTKRTEENYLMLDIGGTTTDIAAVVDGQVLFERDGAVISGYKTLVPAVLTRSIGLGGDSEIRYDHKDGIIIGPKRAGVAMCLGGNRLTPTDAAVALGLADLGSRGLATAALELWGKELGFSPDELAQKIIDAFVSRLCSEVEAFYQELENMPLYTVREVLNPPELRPQAVVGLGAPAPVFIPRLGAALDLPHEVLPYSGGANAIGAAASQLTFGLTLHVDTALATATISEVGYHAEIQRPLFFDLKKARQLAEEKTKEYAQRMGYNHTDQIYIVEEESFQMVRSFRTVGQTHMVRTQLRPEVRRVRGGSV